MHSNARKYKEQAKDCNYRRQQEGKQLKKPKSVEMNNFQNPQVRKENYWRLLFLLICLLLSCRFLVSVLW